MSEYVVEIFESVPGVYAAWAGNKDRPLSPDLQNFLGRKIRTYPINAEINDNSELQEYALAAHRFLKTFQGKPQSEIEWPEAIF